MDLKMTTTTFDLHGYRVTRQLGVVRGVTVRSRGLVGQFAASLRTIGGGKIHEYVSLCEETRGEAFDLMVQRTPSSWGPTPSSACATMPPSWPKT